MKKLKKESTNPGGKSDMRKMEALKEVLQIANEQGAVAIRIQLEPDFVIEATLAPTPPKRSQSEDTKEREDLSYYHS